ncbi:Uncharacterised protein [Mycobacteroides abscessus subsp. abscessus]|nr:Uncharacterised protein [Mycobacteroides abscessus subsp. abscessus]
MGDDAGEPEAAGGEPVEVDRVVVPGGLRVALSDDRVEPPQRGRPRSDEVLALGLLLGFRPVEVLALREVRRRLRHGEFAVDRGAHDDVDRRARRVGEGSGEGDVEVDDVTDAHRPVDVHPVAHMDHAHQRQRHRRVGEELHAQREREDVEVAGVDGVGQRRFDDPGEPGVRGRLEGDAAPDLPVRE